MLGSVRSGSVNPDSQPPRPWSHVDVPPNPPPPRPPPVESAFVVSGRGPPRPTSPPPPRAATLAPLVSPRTVGTPRPPARPPRPAVESAPPRPPPRPRPAPAAIPRVAVVASGAVLGPRIVPLSCRLP